MKHLNNLEYCRVLKRIDELCEQDELRRFNQGLPAVEASQLAVLREQGAPAATSPAVVAVKADGTVTLCTETARSYLEWYFKDNQGASNSLPQDLQHWMRIHELQTPKSGHIPRPHPPYTTERNGRRLTVHLLCGRTTSQRLLLLEEKRLQFSSEALQRHFGLSARRAEVLLWLAQGKASDEIAMILSVSVSTIHKHTERIFEKLGVESQTAAALQAVEVMNRTP